MSKYGLLRGIERAATSAADDIGERLKQERLAAIQANRDAMQVQTRREEATTAFEREKELQGKEFQQQKELAKINSKKAGLPADLVTHKALVEFARSKDPLVSQAAKHALGVSKTTSPEKKEDLVQGYVKLIAEAQNEAGLIQGVEGFQTVGDIRKTVLDMLDAKEQPPTQESQETIVIKNHPEYGDITEGDIQETMRATGMNRSQVMMRLKSQTFPVSGQVIRE